MGKKASNYPRSITTAATFTNRYGKDESQLESWQRLCRDVGVEEGNSITQCKKNMKGKFINIVDFVNGNFTIFSTAKALRQYILSTDQRFSLRAAKDNPFLKALLIQVY